MISEVNLQQFEQFLISSGYQKHYNIFRNNDKLIIIALDISNTPYVIFENDHDYMTEIAVLPENVAYIYHSDIISPHNIDGYYFIVSHINLEFGAFPVIIDSTVRFRVQHPGHCTYYADIISNGTIKPLINLSNGEHSAINQENAMNCINKLIEIYL